MNRKIKILSQINALTLLMASVFFGVGVSFLVVASDHDDGEVNQHSLALTDLYVSMESAESGNNADSGNLLLIMNSHPRSLPTLQNFFSANARYEFHLTRVLKSNRALIPTGSNDITLRFEFGSPGTDNIQNVTITAIMDGQSQVLTSDASGNSIRTTTLAAGQGGQENVQTVRINGTNAKFFAGLREDPFYFDVKAFFQTRAGIARDFALAADPGGLSPSFNAVAEAEDFAKGYNVNTIALSIPVSALTGGNSEVTTFDVWETISVPN